MAISGHQPSFSASCFFVWYFPSSESNGTRINTPEVTLQIGGSVNENCVIYAFLLLKLVQHNATSHRRTYVICWVTSSLPKRLYSKLFQKISDARTIIAPSYEAPKVVILQCYTPADSGILRDAWQPLEGGNPPELRISWSSLKSYWAA